MRRMRAMKPHARDESDAHRHARDESDAHREVWCAPQQDDLDLAEAKLSKGLKEKTNFR
jgi:hypothetical protein